MVQIVATADLHGELPDIPPCDLLLIGGDICPDGNQMQQSWWLDNPFRSWLEKVPAKEVVAIAGNHDLIFEQAKSSVPRLKWHYLEDSAIELFGYKIYGTPWQLPFWGAFNLPEDKLGEKYALAPNDVDIFLSHGPAYGIFDEVPQKKTLLNTGSKALRQKVFEIKPKLFICGHIHCSVGICQVEGITCANVSLLNNEMRVANPPVVFDLP